MSTLVALKGRIYTRIFITMEGEVYILSKPCYVGPCFGYIMGRLDENNVLHRIKAVYDFHLKDPDLYFPERQYVK